MEMVLSAVSPVGWWGAHRAWRMPRHSLRLGAGQVVPVGLVAGAGWFACSTCLAKPATLRRKEMIAVEHRGRQRLKSTPMHTNAGELNSKFAEVVPRILTDGLSVAPYGALSDRWRGELNGVREASPRA